MSNPKNLILERGGEKVEINPELWAEALLLAENFGWVPNKLRMYYLSLNGEVSDEEAKGIYDGLDNLFDTALKKPIEVYPLRVDIGELYILKDFLENGKFTFRVIDQ